MVAIRLLVPLAMLTVALLEASGQGPPPAPPILAALDRDGDGELTADELAEAAAALWTLDKNGDGQLTSDELMPFPGGLGGLGGPGPMRHERRKVLEIFDRDRDGILLGQERADARKYVRENAPQHGPPGSGPPGFGPPNGGFEPPPFFGPPGGDMGWGGFWPGPPGDEASLGPEMFGGFGGGMFGGPGPFPGGGPPGPPPFGGGPPGGRSSDPVQPGKRVAVRDVAAYPGRDLYDPTVLRTIFLEFENQDWEEELEDFRATDVDVPARMIVDGSVFDNVGVRFRGNTSYAMVPRGRKRPLNISVGYGQSGQRLHGHRTLNLLNANSDPSFLRSILYSRISRCYLPALDANFVRLVINGESWGVYVNEEQFNKDFVRKWFSDADGARWKAPVNFSGSSGLMYLGEDEQAYRTNYDIKSADDPQAWKRLIALCRALYETPMEKREEVFDALMNVDEILWFLAIDNALIDDDGYFTRASDYSIYLDRQYQRFHLISHDNNEAFRWAGGPGSFGGEWGGAAFDPVSHMDEGNRPLVTALLSYPPWRARYFAHLRTIAEQWLDWNTLGPIAAEYRALIDAQMREDTRSLTSYEDFLASDVSGEGGGGGPFGAPPSIRTFVQQRREFLLNHPEIAQPRPHIASVTHRRVAQEAPATAGDHCVEVEASITGEPTPERVLLYVANRPDAPFQSLDMRDDGQSPDRQAGDGIYTVALPRQVGDCEVRYYVEARSGEHLGTTSFLPRETERGAFRLRLLVPRAERAPVVINEFMTTNRRTVRNPQGEYTDWLELYNRTNADVDVSGMYLSDSADKLLKWKFPDGTVMPPRSWLVVWLDDAEPAAEGLHANFKLSQKGETIYLVDNDVRGNVILDQVAFGPLKKEISLGRSRDGGDPWRPLLPTPGASNRLRE